VSLRAISFIALTLAVVATAACSSTVTLSVRQTEKLVPPWLSGAPRARLGDFTGAPCFREEVKQYLSSPGGLQLALDGDPFDLTLTGGAPRIEVHSNRGDKQAVLLYYTIFVFTAPIAAVMYGAKDWHADAAADGELVATNAGGALVWKKALTVSIAESQRTMPSHDALTSAMRGAVCQKLASTLLNGLAEHLTAAGPRQGHLRVGMTVVGPDLSFSFVSPGKLVSSEPPK